MSFNIMTNNAGLYITETDNGLFEINVCEDGVEDATIFINYEQLEYLINNLIRLKNNY